MKKLISGSILFSGLLLMSSCVDDNYDLSNIDTTTAFKFDHLVVPVNLATVTLEKVLDIDNSDLIVKFPENADPNDQIYAFKKSSSINVDDVYVDVIQALDPFVVEAKSIVVNDAKIEKEYTNYNYTISNVDPALVSLEYLGMADKPIEVMLTVKAEGSSDYIELDNLIIKIPSCFTGTYKGNAIVDGFVNVGNLTNGQLDEPIYLTALDYGDTPNRPVNHQLTIEGDDLGIESATVVTTGFPQLIADFTMSPFTANVVSGEIDYTIDSPYIDPISLSDLPGFLKDGDSDIILSNPQIYLNFNNPVGAPYSFDLNINPIGNQGTTINESVNPFLTNIVLAANTNDLNLKDEYPTDNVQAMPSLQYIVAGSGLPEYIDINLQNLAVKGMVEKLEIGTYMGVHGDYTFFAPLSMEPGSNLIYHNYAQNFFKDDLTKANVTEIILTAYPVSYFPFDLALTVYPLDKDGNRIKDANNVEVSGHGTIPANAPGNIPLDITVNQPFTGLDGIEYEVIISDDMGETMAPEQNITLNNIRAKVTGEIITVDKKYKEDYQ